MKKCWKQNGRLFGVPKGISFGHSSTGVSPRPMLMGASRNALRAFNARVSLTCPYVVARKLPYLLYGLVWIARSWRSWRTGRPAQYRTECIRLPYAAQGFGRAFFFKIPQAMYRLRRARKGRETCPIGRSNQHYMEACYNAADQFGLKPKPHFFIDAQVFITIFVFERSGGKSPDVILIVSKYSGNSIGVAA